MDIGSQSNIDSLMSSFLAPRYNNLLALGTRGPRIECKTVYRATMKIKMMASIAKKIPQFFFLLILFIAQPACADTPELWSYRVQNGDSLHRIATRYLENKHDWREIQRCNKIKKTKPHRTGFNPTHSNKTA